LAWGEAQAKDYVDNHYHKPADAFREDWDFAGLAKMASFGYALGQAAASQDEVIRWLPGGEFEKAWRKYQSGTIDTDALFAGHPELKIVQFGPILYPPLARQTRIGGTVVAHVTVASDGKVSQARAEGHPLLVTSVEDFVKKWIFAPGAERTFDLHCDFVLADEPLTTRWRNSFVVGPLHVRIVAYSVTVQTSGSGSRNH
jgi:hypothetical protein